jgi:hypothetical protein
VERANLVQVMAHLTECTYKSSMVLTTQHVSDAYILNKKMHVTCSLISVTFIIKKIPDYKMIFFNKIEKGKITVRFFFFLEILFKYFLIL